MSKSDSYDSRRYDCCAPYYGDIGEEFTRRFKPEFEGALHGFVDNYASLYEHVVLRNDPGSAADPPAAGAAGNAVRTFFALRQKKSYGLIRKHIEDATIRDAIDAAAMGDGPAAWALVNQMCSRPQTFLNLADQDKEWVSLSLSEVGVGERTVENFRALLDRVNRERPVAQRKSNIQVWQRLLEGIASIGNAEIRTMVRNELQVPTMVHPIGSPLVGEPDIPRYVQHFAERWRVLVHDGAIKQSAPRKRSPPIGNRVDAMVSRVTEEDESAPDTLNAFAARMAPGGAAESGQLEKMCWNCRGLGHVKVDAAGKIICPSPVKARSITSAIAALEIYRRREAGRGGKRKMFVKRPVPAAKSITTAAQDDLMEVMVDDDGTVYSTEGVFMGHAMDMLGQFASGESSQLTMSQSETMTAPVNVANSGSSYAEHGSRPADSVLSMQVQTMSGGDEMSEAHVDDSFYAGFIPQACANVAELGSAEDDIDELCNTQPSQSEARLRRRPVLLVAGSIAILASTAAPRGIGRLLLVMGMVSLAAAQSPKLAVVSVQTSLLSSRTDPNAGQLNSRTGAAIDTGASMHVSGRKDLFPPALVTDHHPMIKVQIANDIKCSVELKGTMRVPVRFREGINTSATSEGCLMLKNSLYVPELRENTLLSPRAMFHDHGMRTYFNDDRFIRTSGGQFIDFVETSTLYVLPFSKGDKQNLRVLAAQKAASADDVHSRCMHFSIDKIRRSVECLENAQAIGEQTAQTGGCRSCGTANARRQNAPAQSAPKFTKPGECVCSDTCDMGEYSTPFGFRYFLTFMDMATRYLWVYFLRTHAHTEVRAAYTQFMADATPYFDQGKVKLWFTDNGSEFSVASGVGKDKPGYFANDTDTWLAEYFTRRRFIVPWHPNQNPAESMNRVLLRPARAAIHAAGVHTRFWPFAIHQAAVVHNALITLSLTATHVRSAVSMLIDVIEGAINQMAKPQSPFMMLRKRKFDFSLLHTLFCLCDVLIRNPGDLACRPKAASRMTKAIHLGLDLRRAGFYVYLIEFQRFTTSAIRDTVFDDEQSFPRIGQFIGGEIRQGDDASRLRSSEQQAMEQPADEYADREAVEHPEDRGDRMELRPADGPPSSRTRARVRERDALVCRVDETPAGYVTVATENGSALAVKEDVWRPIQCPTSSREAMEQDREGWLQAYMKDFKAKMENGAFEYVPMSDGMHVHKCIWAHKLIWNDDNTLAEKRARLVGCGYTQVQGRDYAASYSGTPKATAVRLFLAAVAVYDLEDEHCDVVKAFTQNEVTDAKLFVSQPPFLPVVLDDKGKPMVMRVVMALEGFKQSGHIHQINHTRTFTHNDVAKFEYVESEPTLLVHVDGEKRIMALVWTDDVLFAYSAAASALYERFLRDVYGKRWNYKRKGNVSRFVGIDIKRERTQRTLTLSLSRYIEGIHSKFVQRGHTPRSAPYKSPEHVKAITVAKDGVDRERVADKPYLAAVASCIWAYSVLRADIAYVLNVLCGVMHDPSMEAWEAVVDLISYLHHTRDLKIVYSADPKKWSVPSCAEKHRDRLTAMCGLQCWVDASWREPSVAGYIFLLAGGAIDWSCKTIKVICHSSAEAETSAGCIAAKASVYVRNVASATGFKINGAIVMLMDSEAAIAIGSNLGVTKRTAHFLRWQHYLRWCQQHQYITLVFVSGKRQLADALTKPVDITLMREFRSTVYGA